MYRHEYSTRGGENSISDGRDRNRVGGSSLARSGHEDSGFVVDRPGVGLGPGPGPGLGLGLGLGLDQADLEWIDHARCGRDFDYGDHGIEGGRWSNWGCTYRRVWSWPAPVRLQASPMVPRRTPSSTLVGAGVPRDGCQQVRPGDANHGPASDEDGRCVRTNLARPDSCGRSVLVNHRDRDRFRSR